MLLVSAGTWGVAVRSTSASPSARYRAWLVEQAEAERAGLVEAALARMGGETATPALFLSRYAEAQLATPAPVVRMPASASRATRPAAEAVPTGAWFGHPGLSFLDALALLEGRLRTFDAPASSQRLSAAQAAPLATTGVPLPPPPSPQATAARAEHVRTDAPAPSEPRVGVAVLHGASAAQPQGP